MTLEEQMALLAAMSAQQMAVVVATATASTGSSRRSSSEEGGGDEPLSLTNTQKLSLDPATPVGTQVQVTDGVAYSGVASGAAFQGEDIGGHHTYVTPGHANADSKGFSFDFDHWVFDGNDLALAGVGNTTFPWEADWSGVGLTLTHPAVQQLAAPSTAQGGVFVSGGTVYDGLYKNVGAIHGRDGYDILGSFASVVWHDDINGDLGIGPSSSGWVFSGDDLPTIYSLSDVAAPNLATNWKYASDDSPADITVAAVTEGQMVAGLTVSGAGVADISMTVEVDGTYDNRGIANGRFLYVQTTKPTNPSGMLPSLFGVYYYNPESGEGSHPFAISDS